ncbi:hypothetical protein C4579_03915 [Candidatus Microgenomates bacterium]|nr:MAG: hypothetical protein C4579_03915 [Candidatus Microgenomates bacterium]
MLSKIFLVVAQSWVGSFAVLVEQTESEVVILILVEEQIVGANHPYTYHPPFAAKNQGITE